ncbi:hypothetical protein [[Pseudomonas] boreopolis]|uniref:M61 family metallopeptidase n=1 Tax=Xanthomonas boreopolis TaxID=86183 RepID=UPI003DA10078
MLFHAWVIVFSVLIVSCTGGKSPVPQQQPLATELPAMRPAEPVLAAKPVASDSIRIRFLKLADEGLTVSVTTPGDDDGQTTFSNRSCCGLGSVQDFIADVRVTSDAGDLHAIRSRAGWTVRHRPGLMLTVTYRLPRSGETTIDSGIRDQVRPIVHNGAFHLIGDTALLLPVRGAPSDRIELDVDAQGVADQAHFVSSFGPGSLHGVVIPKSQVVKALYLGGRIDLEVRDTPRGRVGIAYSGMAPSFHRARTDQDILAILDAERGFFADSQPWYLVSVRGGRRIDPQINLGGGMGLTDSFAMFARSDLDMSNAEQAEQFRWVLAHEYFHHWNGLALRVASLPGTDRDDVATYWFSEGVTEFYTMRLLTRGGLQGPDRSLVILNKKLSMYAANDKRNLGAKAAAATFWKSKDSEQIPYLRGYIAAWYADLAIRRATHGERDLDQMMRALVLRAKAQPEFRVDNDFLVQYLARDLPEDEGRRFRSFILDGGAGPLTEDSFAPCLYGQRTPPEQVLQFHPPDADRSGCFRH